MPDGGVGEEAGEPSAMGGVQNSGKAPRTPVLKISALLPLSRPMMSPAFTGRFAENWSGAVVLPVVVSVALDATAANLPPPAGRRMRSLTLLPALPEAIRQATIVPSTGDA